MTDVVNALIGLGFAVFLFGIGVMGFALAYTLVKGAL